MSRDYCPRVTKPPLPKMKEYAGQYNEPPTPYRNTQGIIGYSGHLPGLTYAIGTSYPTMTKLSRSYTEQISQVIAEERSVGRATGSSVTSSSSSAARESRRDKWGNFVPPRANTSELKDLYLQALHTDTASPSAVTPPAASTPPVTGATKLSPSSKASVHVHPEAPRHIAGYSGYRPGASEFFAKSFNRVERAITPRSSAAKSATETSKVVDYEYLNYSPERAKYTPPLR